jgi:hypothetical protein
MRKRAMVPQGRTVAGLAAILLLSGIVVDVGFVQPRLREISRLRTQMSDAKARVAQQSRQVEEVERLMRGLGVADLGEAIADQGATDPVTFLGRMIDEARLTRLELSTRASGDVGHLRRTRFSLRILGTYPRFVELVRSLEQSKRLVTIEALSLEPASEASGLEGRLDVSIYDPIPGKQP